MVRLFSCAALGSLVLLPPLLADPGPTSPASATTNPRANELFDGDSDLRDWALRIYDANRDGWLTLYEAQPALAAFRDIADGDLDGQVTPTEYARAKEFISARY